MADTNRPGTQTGVARSDQQQNRSVSRRQDWPMRGLGGDLLSMSPFSIMRRLSEEMDRIFGETGGTQTGGRGGEMSRMWSPALEVRQRGNDLVVCAELPGIEPDQVNVELNNDTLVIEGERKREESSDQGGLHRSERSYGRFYRAIPLPEQAKADQAKANFNNGVLEVVIPMEQQAENRRRIPVQSGTASSGGSTVKTGGGTASSGGSNQR